jgi:hypothetical protein
LGPSIHVWYEMIAQHKQGMKELQPFLTQTCLGPILLF